MNDFTHFTDTESDSYILPSVTAGSRLCLLSSIYTKKILDSRSEASSKHSLCCLTPADSSLNSSPNVLFLIKAFTYFTVGYHNKNSCFCQAGVFRPLSSPRIHSYFCSKILFTLPHNSCSFLYKVVLLYHPPVRQKIFCRISSRHVHTAYTTRAAPAA